MSEPTNTAVECPICGEGFDPTAAGGWCTNPECGEWQYLGDEVPEPDESPVDPAPATGSEAAESTATASSDDAAKEDESIDVGEPESTEATDEPTGAGTSDEDSGIDAPADESAEPVEFTARPGETAEEVAGHEGADEAEEDADLEIEAGDEAESSGDEPGEADLVFESAVELQESDEAAIDAVCPDCEASIDLEDNFCPECGADLHESTAETCPDCGAEVDAEDAFCGACGADLEDGSTPAQLALRARGQEVLVDADQTVGREIRRLVTDTGGEEDEAVRIHREHLRFVREDGRFYVVDLGDNPTEVNGRRLMKGDREPIGPGDEIGLSGVVTLSVAEP